MSDELIDVRTTLAASAQTRVEIGRDGVLHVLAGPVTLHLDRGACEELTTTLARAMVALARARAQQRPALALVPSAAEPLTSVASAPTQQRP
ncbi:MAG TPA: hypothetical protein VFS67_19225 [Polyangiaceae bacterium]|jgi:hypothetical protein|nr:hypothetical protein [Polyangiaceae bacterium]